jgi:hypothetical protein
MNVCACPQADRSLPNSAAKSLSQRDRTEQVCTALGCGRWRLPTVDGATLRHCYRYLSENLSLPCVAWYPEPTSEDGGYPCTVLELIDPATGPGDKFGGIFCKVRKGKHERNLPLIKLEWSPDEPNCESVKRYRDCFWQWR